MLTEIKFQIEGICSQNDKALIETEVDVLEGVVDSNIDERNGEAWIEFDNSEVSEKRLFRIIEKLGFEIKEEATAYAAVFVSIWIDKGLGLIVPGFIPSPIGEILEYVPTAPEVLITLGVWALGLLILTILYKIAVSVKEEVST